jgi:hypothetical protein
VSGSGGSNVDVAYLVTPVTDSVVLHINYLQNIAAGTQTFETTSVDYYVIFL